jgi:hypothetical protein
MDIKTWPCELCTVTTGVQVVTHAVEDGKAWCPTLGFWVKAPSSLLLARREH